MNFECALTYSKFNHSKVKIIPRMIDENTLEKIEAYLSEKMPAEVKAKFEKEMVENPALAQKVKVFKTAQKTVLAAARNDLRGRVDKVFEKNHRENKSESKVVNLRRALSIAAGVMILIGSLVFFNVFTDEMSSSEAFTAYYERPAAPTVRSGEELISEVWSKAVGLYSENDFPKVIETLLPLIEAGNFSNQNEGRLILGIAFLERDEPGKAVEQFEKISPVSSFAGQAAWYRAMVGLKYHDIENTMVQLKNIAEKGGFKSREAKEILEKLK